MKQPRDMIIVSVIDIIEKNEIEVLVIYRFFVEKLAAVLMNFDGEGIHDYDEIVFSLTRIVLYLYSPMNLDLVLKKKANSSSKAIYWGATSAIVEEIAKQREIYVFKL